MLTRRHAAGFAAVALTAAVVAGCAATETGLPSDEVLRRAAEASARLSSATLDIEVDLVQPMEVRAALKGRLQNSGEQMDLAVQCTSPDSGIDISGNVILLGQDEVYARIDRMELGDAAEVLSLPVGPDLMHRWWKIPGSSAGVPAGITPDPGLLNMQASVVRVTRDHGIETSADGRAYHYETALDPEKFSAYLRAVAQAQGKAFEDNGMEEVLKGSDVTGELWIDAESFYVRSFQWEAAPLKPGALEGTLRVEIHDHDAAQPVVPPDDAEILPLSSFDDLSLPLLSTP